MYVIPVFFVKRTDLHTLTKLCFYDMPHRRHHREDGMARFGAIVATELRISDRKRTAYGRVLLPSGVSFFLASNAFSLCKEAGGVFFDRGICRRFRFNDTFEKRARFVVKSVDFRTSNGTFQFFTHWSSRHCAAFGFSYIFSTATLVTLSDSYLSTSHQRLAALTLLGLFQIQFTLHRHAVS